MSKYKVWCPEHGCDADDGLEVEAMSPGIAAELWAEEEDCLSAEYTIASGDTVEVCVMDLASGEVSRWSVTGEAVPHYTAHKCSSTGE